MSKHIPMLTHFQQIQVVILLIFTLRYFFNYALGMGEQVSTALLTINNFFYYFSRFHLNESNWAGVT